MMMMPATDKGNMVRHYLLTCATNVQIQMVMKTTFRWRPSKTFRCPWILRALISLNKVIITNVLKMTVKCCVGCPLSRPLSMSSSRSPTHSAQLTYSNFYLLRISKHIRHINVVHSPFYTFRFLKLLSVDRACPGGSVG